MRGMSKRVRHLRDKLKSVGVVDVSVAIEALKALEKDLPTGIRPCRFDQTVTLAIRLGIDSRQSDQSVRGSIVLPHGSGKNVRVLAFVQGANVQVAESAGADYYGSKELAAKIQSGWLEFDVAVATPDMMSVVGPLGKVLGPRSLMPSPKAGTVTGNIGEVIRDYKAGRVAFRTDSSGNLHAIVGKLSFDRRQLIENVESLLKLVKSLKPSTSKGQYLRGMSISATMTPSIRLTV